MNIKRYQQIEVCDEMPITVKPLGTAYDNWDEAIKDLEAFLLEEVAQTDDKTIKLEDVVDIENPGAANVVYSTRDGVIQWQIIEINIDVNPNIQ